MDKCLKCALSQNAEFEYIKIVDNLEQNAEFLFKNKRKTIKNFKIYVKLAKMRTILYCKIDFFMIKLF